MNQFRYFIFLLAFNLSVFPLLGQIISVFPYSENFDSGSPFWVANNTGSSTTNWELGSPNYGLTSSTHSGLNCWDINLNTAYDINAISNLETPEFNFTNLTYATLSFWQNRNSELNYDGFHIDYSMDQGFSWNYLGQYLDPLGTNWYNTANLFSITNAGWSGNNNGWQKSSYVLSAFNNVPSVKFRFVFTSDAFSVLDGVSIDDFEITPALAVDASLNSILTPLNRLVSGTTVPSLNILVANYSGSTLNNYNISYRINGGTPIIKNFFTPILPFTTDTLNIPGFIVPAGQFNICISVNTSGDLDHSNDSICYSAIGFPTLTIPYIDNFEGPNNGWTVNNPTDTLSKWELGLPTFGITSSTHSGNNCWDVNLNSPYGYSANTELWSPTINFTGIYNSSLSFWKNYYTELNYDGTRLDYSFDGGSSWFQLGNYGDSLGVNWYDISSINSTTKPAWAGTSGSWQKATYKLTILDNQPNVIFRFVFNSDVSVNKDGFSIDDFKITQALAKDVSLDSIASPIYNALGGSTINPIQLKIKNNSNQSISNFNVGYKINNGTITSVNYSSILIPNGTTIVSLPGFTVPYGNYTFTAFVDLLGDLDQSNDSLIVTGFGQPILIPTSFENFESGNQTWNTQTLGNSNTNWELGLPAYGSTSSTHSGNNAWDINLNTTYGSNALTYLYTPFYDLSASINPYLSFWQNRNTDFASGFLIEYFDSNTGIWQPMPYFSGNGVINWHNSTVSSINNLSGWTGNTNGWIKSGIPLNLLNITGSAQFRFVFASSGFPSGDGLSIDDFKINTDYQNDAEIISITSPGPQAAAGGTTDVIVSLRNNGIQTLNSINIKYKNNNGTPVTYLWTGTLLTGSSTVVTLPQVLPSAGINNIAVYVDWINDEYHENDTLKYSYSGISILTPPFSDNLENGNLFWYVTPSGFGSTTWELGSPNYGSTNSCHSGSNCWDINLLSPYGILANTTLYSPYINYSNSLTSTLDFWMNYDSEFNQDGLRLEYSTNGNIWNVLGIQNDPNGTNWYNSTITPQSKPGWSGTSGGWIHSIYNTTAFNGLSFIRYRFVYTSDLSLTAPGFSIDDFNVDQTVGLKDLVDGIKFNISPNPANDILNLHFENLANKTYIYKIYDVSGRLIQTPKNNSTIASSDLTISINDLSQGIYQLMIIVDGYKKMVSFVKN